MERILHDRGAEVLYEPDFLDEAEADALEDELRAQRESFDRDRVVLYGRTIDSPRLVCAFGDEGLQYRYAGVERSTRPWTSHLRRTRDRIAGVVVHPLNYALVNLYRDGNDYIGWHSDKTADLLAGSTIASLSLGAVRRFSLRDKKSGETQDLELAHGSLLLMKGLTQRYYKHSLPRRRAVKRPRFNVTFRCVEPSTSA